jgi:hypothetical protein
MLFLRHPPKIVLALLAVLELASPARAAGRATSPAAPIESGKSPTPEERKRAATAYDRAVRLFDAAKYADAARAFLEADQLAPNSEALSSAIASARSANDHLLVVEVAERAMARESADPRLAGAARAALSEAEAHLARVELQCRPAPCSLLIEGAPVDAGRHYLLPGTYLFAASYAAPNEPVEQRTSLEAGSLYNISLSARPAASAESRPAPPRLVPSHTVEAQGPPSGHESLARKPLKPWTLYVGTGVTVALGGITVWSGLDALSRADHYKATRTVSDRSRATASIRRTDWLLVGTALAAGASVFAAVRLVDFGPDKSTVSVVAVPTGAFVRWSGRL